MAYLKCTNQSGVHWFRQRINYSCFLRPVLVTLVLSFPVASISNMLLLTLHYLSIYVRINIWLHALGTISVFRHNLWSYQHFNICLWLHFWLHVIVDFTSIFWALSWSMYLAYSIFRRLKLVVHISGYCPFLTLRHCMTLRLFSGLYREIGTWRTLFRRFKLVVHISGYCPLFVTFASLFSDCTSTWATLRRRFFLYFRIYFTGTTWIWPILFFTNYHVLRHVEC